MDEISVDLKFSIVPHWVIDSGISARAVRLYAVLAKFADAETAQAYPGRTRLSKELHCSLKSVDRAVAELEGIGAIRKQHRVNEGVYQSSLYTVVRSNPVSRVTRPRVKADPTPRQGRRDPVSGVTHRTITTELEPVNIEPLNNIDTLFQEFWDVYPKKADKRLARRAFEKALKRSTADVIVAGAIQYRDDPHRQPAFTKNASTWLNADAWENDPIPAPLNKAASIAEENKRVLSKYLDEGGK
jgi:hypothetical protein